MAAHPTIRLSTQNHHRKEFWFPLFRYMEGSVLKPVPRRFDCPLPMGRLRSVFRRRVGNARIE
ncbi:hypothetical protein ANCCEY_02588 [Ancylostoma ceylanicum]|nr:hypothetical protein ANCCEY_02588 [Ancylostoma ceylanicum]